MNIQIPLPVLQNAAEAAARSLKMTMMVKADKGEAITKQDARIIYLYEKITTETNSPEPNQDVINYSINRIAELIEN